MFKKALFAAALLVASSPAFVSAQDSFFFSFDQGAATPTTTVANTDIGSTGSLFIFADENLDFNQLDIDFNNDNAGVVSFTGGVVFNEGAAASGAAAEAPGGSFTSFSLLDPAGPGGVTATDGRIFATSFLSPGQQPGSGASNFSDGANGFLLAQVDFDIVGAGTSDLSFTAGDLGFVNDGAGQLAVSFGTGSITVSDPIVDPPVDPPVIPEPSSAILLILGAAGMAARRRRS